MCEKYLTLKNKVFNKRNSLTSALWPVLILYAMPIVLSSFCLISLIFSPSSEQYCPSGRLGLSPFIGNESDHHPAIQAQECNAILTNERKGPSKGILGNFPHFKDAWRELSLSYSGHCYLCVILRTAAVILITWTDQL